MDHMLDEVCKYGFTCTLMIDCELFAADLRVRGMNSHSLYIRTYMEHIDKKCVEPNNLWKLLKYLVSVYLSSQTICVTIKENITFVMIKC